MLSAQDEAFLRLAVDRGLLTAAAAERRQASPSPERALVQDLVDAGELAPAKATELLRIAMSLRYLCGRCGCVSTKCCKIFLPPRR